MPSSADHSGGHPWIDIHCHCLPGVDDGPNTLSGALDLCRQLVANGVGQVIATPHQLGRYEARNLAGEIRSAVARLQSELERATIPPTSTESANSGPATSDQTAPGTDEPTTSITASSPPTNNETLPSTPWPRGVVITVGGSTSSEIVSELGRSPIFIGKAAIAISFPDGGGTGVMWQRASGPTAPDGSPNSTDDTDIVRVLPDGRQLILYSTRQGQWLRLHDVAVVDGAPVVLYSVRSGTTPQTTVEVLKLARPASASNVDLGVIGGWESGTGRLHIGGNLIVGEASSGASHSMFALTTSGQVGLDPRSLGVDLSYGDCSDCPHSFTISPDGATVAWIDKSDLVIETLGQIAGARRVALPAAMVGRAGDLQIRGDAVVFNPEPTGSGPQAAIAIDIASGIAALAPIPGVGSLT